MGTVTGAQPYAGSEAFFVQPFFSATSIDMASGVRPLAFIP